jgi:hypothetical protein
MQYIWESNWHRFFYGFACFQPRLLPLSIIYLLHVVCVLHTLQGMSVCIQTAVCMVVKLNSAWRVGWIILLLGIGNLSILYSKMKGISQNGDSVGKCCNNFDEISVTYSSSSYIATDGQSASSSWCRAPFGAGDQILHFSEWNYFLSFSCRAPFLTRGLVCNLQCNDASWSSSYIATYGLSANSSRCRAPNGARDQTLISLFYTYFLSSRWMAPLPIFPMDRVIQPYVKVKSQNDLWRTSPSIQQHTLQLQKDKGKLTSDRNVSKHTLSDMWVLLLLRLKQAAIVCLQQSVQISSYFDKLDPGACYNSVLIWIMRLTHVW